MIVKQFEYKPLSHYSYAIISDGQMAVVDPERDPMQYYAFAKANNATITTVIETHPHADFISAHLQIHEETGATIYNSEKLGGDYPHKGFDEGDSIKLGKAVLKAINTPGHSPDSITIVAEEGEETYLFTGDTLFIGDVGRPDLREKAGNIQAKREELAEMMYETMQSKFDGLPDDAKVYPAHGAGSLCGSALGDASSSTLGSERTSNWAFNTPDKEEFLDRLLNSQPFIPHYFSHSVGINKAGARNVRTAMAAVPFAIGGKAEGFIVDVRDESVFKAGHLKDSFNIQATSPNAKFETWLGTILRPSEDYILVISEPEDLEHMLERVAKIGYEQNLKQVVVLSKEAELSAMEELDLEHFKNNTEDYTIVDIRNQSEIEEGKFFERALAHPLPNLRDTAEEIPTDKPIVVHCAAGFRSAAGSSILKSKLDSAKVYDLSDAVKDFK